MYTNPRPQSIRTTSNFGTNCAQNYINVVKYPCTKFQLIWRTSDFGTKLAQKNMNDKNFEKIMVKIVISI